MRAVKVPSSIAVTVKGVHYVVTTVNSCPSFQAHRRDTQVTSSGPTISTSCSPSHTLPLEPFRLTFLLPSDWSALLRMCRRLTHPGASFNFSSPGDTTQHSHRGHLREKRDLDDIVADALSPAERDTAAAAASIESNAPLTYNHAYMHIVQRISGDFTPNNMIYHQLQKFHLVPRNPKNGPLQGESTPTGASMTAFTQLVLAAQQQPPQAPEEVSAELLNEEDTARAAASAEEKRTLDPLFHSSDAVAKSTANAEQLRAYTAASADDLSNTSAAIASAWPYTFTFYPYPVSAADSIPYCSKHFCVLVNLKPIVPYHLMVVPIRCVGTIHGLTDAEVEDWGHVMCCTINVLEDLHRQQHQLQKLPQHEDEPKSYFGGNYSIAVQQGALAGQTVDHLHVHVIPFDPQGKLAGEPETDEAEQRRRPPRTPAVMRAETEVLRPLFAKYAAPAAIPKKG